MYTPGMGAALPTNLLYFGDNLDWLQNAGKFPDESVDLVYLDPPFNSNRSYNVLFKESDVRESEAQIHAFEDTWSWDREGRVEAVYNDFWMTAPEKPKQMLKSMIMALGHNDVTAYLTMMAPRLVELHRVLKPTGSLYLHCDPTASHYLKVLLDSIFGPRLFQGEVVWQRTNARSTTGRWPRLHDTLLFYSKSSRFQFHPERVTVGERKLPHTLITGPDGKKYQTYELTAPGITKEGDSGRPWRGRSPSAMGRHWGNNHQTMDGWDADGLIHWPKNGGFPRRRDGTPFVVEDRMSTVGDVWTDIDRLNQTAKERLGYDTQKPVALLERIIVASSNEGDVVLDPFCGCGTAVHAAQKLGRQWIGIDITPLATDLIRRRLEDAFPGLKVPIDGWPADYAGAAALAAMEDKYHFQDWAVIQAGGRPAGGERKKGADRGVDGVIPFIDGPAGPKRGIISAKAGNTGPAHVRDLAGVVSRDPDAAFGVFVCLSEPTKPMNEEALSHGVWVSEYNSERYPKIQILSAQDLIDGRQVRMPQGARTSPFAQAERERKVEGRQGRLG